LLLLLLLLLLLHLPQTRLSVGMHTQTF